MLDGPGQRREDRRFLDGLAVAQHDEAARGQALRDGLTTQHRRRGVSARESRH
jgi:hypothetical protein